MKHFLLGTLLMGAATLPISNAACAQQLVRVALAKLVADGTVGAIKTK
jgi:hypothetical protein